jgi:lysophospholipase L1-like esterase
LNPPIRRFLFYLILFFGPILIWLGIELILHQALDRFRPLVADRDKKTLHINQNYFNDFFLYQIPGFYVTSSSNRAIHAEKNSTYRIFCIGESTIAGYPYNTFPQFECPVSFPNYLRAVLQYNKNTPPIELLNAGCNALGSFQVLQVFKDLIRYKPDLVIVYSGHNEFFGPNEFTLPKEKAFLYQNQALSGFYLSLRRTYSYQAIKWLAGFISKKWQTNPQDFAEWSLRNKVSYDDPIHASVRANYQNNLTELVRMAKANGIRIILCAPVSNWTFPPFISKSAKGMNADQKEDWNSRLQQADTSFIKGKYEDALSQLSYLQQKDTTSADLFYKIGKVYTKLADYQSAAFNLWRAKDFDQMPFRAKSFTSMICRDVARREGIILADMEQYYISLSGRYVPLSNLFIDHVHPNDVGNYYMALYLAQLIVENKLLPGVDAIEYPDLGKCHSALKIEPEVLDRIEFDFTQKGYLARLSELNPEIKTFLVRIRNQAMSRMAERKDKWLKEPKESR